MDNCTVGGISIKGVSAAVPAAREDNALLESLTERSKKEIIEQVGIRYRHVANENITAADLCFSAAEALLGEAHLSAQEIGLIVFVTQTPDHTVPGTATQLHFRLGLHPNALCLDINQGCAGYVHGLSVVSGMMKAFGIEHALLLVGDTITRMISKQDNSLRPVFADAGSATLLRSDEHAGKMSFLFGSKGEDFEAIHVRDGGARHPLTEKSLQYQNISEGIVRQPSQLTMNGQAVFSFGLSTVAAGISDLMSNEGLTEQQIDYLVLHQANKLLNDAIVRKLHFPAEKVPSSLYEFGNTSCATIPLTMVSRLREPLMNTKRVLLLSGFGVGLSWGNAIVTTDRLICPDMIYV